MAQLTVSKINGEVLATSRDGVLRALKLGDVINDGETIITKNGSTVSLIDDLGVSIDVPENQTLKSSPEIFTTAPPTAQDSAVTAGTFDTVIEALNRGQDLSTTLEATAAGLSGPTSADGGSSFVQLLRIVEEVDPLIYEYEYIAPDLSPDLMGVVQSVLAEEVETPIVVEPPEVETPVVEPPIVVPGDGNNGHGNNTDGQDDNNPGQGVGGPNSDPKDGDDEDEGNQGDDTPGIGDNDPIPPLLPPEEDVPLDTTPGNSGQNNGWGNGDQTAPGNSLDNNNAENSDATNPLTKDHGKPEKEFKLNADDLLDVPVNVPDHSSDFVGLLFDLQIKPATFE